METTDHPLHKKIGGIIFDNFNNKNGCQVLRDPACGGNQNLSLFYGKEKSNATNFCDVDLLIIQNDEIKLIMEIEESKYNPTQICGKFLTSASSNFYTHMSIMQKKIYITKNTNFIQVLDTKELQSNSKKIYQWENLKKAIKSLCINSNLILKKYELFYGNLEELTFIKEIEKLLVKIL